MAPKYSLVKIDMLIHKAGKISEPYLPAISGAEKPFSEL